jgi:hypothetical protein
VCSRLAVISWFTCSWRRGRSLLAMVLTGGLGLGGWALKDHPQLASWARLLSVVGDQKAELDWNLDSLAKVTGLAESAEVSRRPGRYQVAIEEVRLDPGAFRSGRTVDLQARVLKRDRQGRETTLWDSTVYGENLVVVGQDDLVASWAHRPFELSWAPGERVWVEVWDRRGNFLDRLRYRMAAPEPGKFPLPTGTHSLMPEGKWSARSDSDLNRVVAASRWIGELDRATLAPPAVAERPVRMRRTAEADTLAERPIVIR